MPLASSRTSLALAAAVCSSAATAARAQISIIADTEFADANWTLVNSSDSNTIRRVFATRNPDRGIEGDARVTTVELVVHSAYLVEHYKEDRPWDPGVDGPIHRITWETWYQFQSIYNIGALTLVARQGSSYYRAPFEVDPPTTSDEWRKASGNCAPADMTLLRGPGSPHLDLSPQANPIYFGYRQRGHALEPGASIPASKFVVCLSPRACVADADGSGHVGVDDIFVFLAAWFRSDPVADVNGDVSLDIHDIFAFLAGWFAGC